MQYFRNPSLSVIFAAVYLAVHDIHGVLALPTNARANDGPLRLFAPPNETLHDSNHGAANSVLQRRAPSPITIPLEAGELDRQHFAIIPIGQDQTPFRLVPDTGSADFWVYSASCPTRGNKNGVSSPLVQPNLVSTLVYEQGHGVTVDAVRDNIKFGRKTVNMQFSSASQVTASLANYPEEGVLGFAFPTVSNTGQQCLIDELFSSNLIPERVTGWKFARRSSGLNDGELILGGVNKKLFYSMTMMTVPNLSTEYWKVQIESVSVGNVQIMGARVGSLDTGSRDITTTPSDAARIHAVIPDSILHTTNFYILPCKNEAVVSFAIGGYSWPMKPQDLVGSPVPRGYRYPDYCLSTIQPRTAREAGEITVGTAFMKNIYLKLDAGTNTIGIGRLRRND